MSHVGWALLPRVLSLLTGFADTVASRDGKCPITVAGRIPKASEEAAGFQQFPHQ